MKTFPTPLLLCCVLASLPCMSQDVAALAMPNVDLETQEGRKMEGERAAIRKFFVLFYLSAIIPVMENQGRIGKEEDIYPLMLKVFPEKELKLCPEKLQKLMNDKIQGVKDMLAGKKQMKPEPFDPEEPEIVAFLAAYGMEDLDQQIMNWMGRQIGSESDGKLESVIQAFRHLKAGVESGKIVMPEKVED